MDTDIQIYINNLRKYLESSEKARDLFLSDSIDLDDFISEVERVATLNVKEGKDPQLTKEQYETVRKDLSNDDEVFIEILDKSIINLMDGYPPIFLN